MTYRKVRIVQALVMQDPTSKALLVPSSAQIYLSDKTTVATIYSDTTGTSMTNPVPTGVTVGTAGLDTAGNLDIYVDLGNDYYALVNSVFIPLSTTTVHHADFTDHVDGTISDPHGDRAWALATFQTAGDSSTTAVFG